MTNTYNTGNPVGSTNPKDLLDNASNFDEALNSTSPTFTDRRGVLRDTWKGQEDQFNLAQANRQAAFLAFLADSGFVPLGNYASGLEFTSYNQYMAYGGFFYRPAPSTVPFTTSGTWAGADEDLFVIFSVDDALRQDLASNDSDKGATLITFMGQDLASRLGKVAYVTDFATPQAAIDSGAAVLVWPAGTYTVTRLTPVSNQAWIGASREATVVQWAQQDIPSLTYSMVQASGDLQNFHVRDMTFKGNRPYQTTESVANQDMGCFHLRAGDVINVSVENCVIRDFGMLNLKGDNTTAGHGALIGNRADGVTGKKIRNVRFTRNEFRDISNVPGVYICGQFDTTGYINEMTGVFVEDNDFIVDITTAIQNCVYVLGDAVTIGRNVRVNRNNIHISKPIDCGIEINYLRDYWTDDNEVYATGTGTCTPVLIRDSTSDGSVCGNRIRSISSGTGNAAGISIVAFGSATESQTRVKVHGNSVLNWGTSSSGCAFNLSAGSANIDLAFNTVTGNSGSNRIESAFILGDGVSNIKMHDNTLKFVKYPLRYAGGATGCEFSDNTLESCGDGSTSLIISNAGGYAVTVNTVARNTVLTPISGTANLVGIVSTANTRNRVLRNNLPSTMATVNPSYLTAQETIETTSVGSGKALLGLQYQFAQGALSIANGAGFTIGNLLDAQGPVCKVGDFVIATYVGDALGATISPGYVIASGQARFRVSNNTGATINVPAGNWNVLIIPS